MYYDGKITEQMVYDATCDYFSFNAEWREEENITVSELIAKEYEMVKLDVEWDSNIANGKCEQMGEAVYGSFIQDIFKEAERGVICICVLDTKEKRERVDHGIQLINAFQENPTDENRVRFEDMFFSEELTEGEILLLDAWFTYNPNYINEITVDGQSYDNWNYAIITERDGESIAQIIDNARETLFELNNTPDSEKDEYTAPEIPAVLTEQERADILALPEAQQLMWFRENCNDEWAALQLESMHGEGELSDAEYPAALAQFASGLNVNRRAMLQSVADCIGSGLTEQNAAALTILSHYMGNGIVPISMFDTAENRALALEGVNLVNAFRAASGKNHAASFVNFVLSENMPREVFVFLIKYAGAYDLLDWAYLSSATMDEIRELYLEYTGAEYAFW